MVLSVRLDLRQTQSLVMTPQLQQAIKLLQLSNLDLSAYVEQELERNPSLQRNEGGDESVLSDPHDSEPSDPRALAVEGAEHLLDSIRGQTEAPLDIDYDNVFTDDAAGRKEDWGGSSLFDRWGQGRRAGFEGPDNAIEWIVSGGMSLRDHLSAQLSLEVGDPADRVIGAHLIEMLDDAGYLSDDLQEVATQLGCDLTRIEAVLARMQQFDPPGIFARTLKECLAIQLREHGPA